MTKRIILDTILIGMLCICSNGSSYAASVIDWFGGLNSTAYGINTDSTVVVGSLKTQSNFLHAFRWTRSGGVQDLGTLGGFASTSRGVNADGSVVVGWANTSSSAIHAFRWTQAGGMQDLGTLGGSTSIAYGVNTNGAVVVGTANTIASLAHAFRWTQAGGMQDLGTLGGSTSAANGVNSDGSIVVGYAQTVASNIHAFSWSESLGMKDLGTLGGPTSVAFGVSSDGAVIVGWASTASSIHAFRHDQTGGMQDLGVLPGYTNSVGYGVNSNGSVVVGFCQIGFDGKTAFRWTQTGGMQSVADWIVANGGNALAAGNSLEVAYGASPDGNIIVGNGFLNGQAQAFIATYSGVLGIGDFQNSLKQPLVAGAILHDQLRAGIVDDLQNNAPRRGQFAFSSQAVYSRYTRDIAEGNGISGVFKLIYGITDTLRAGIGYIPGGQHLTMADNGKIRNNIDIFGGLLSYGDYRGDGIRARLSFAYGSGNADLTRNYLTGGGPDQSAGRMRIHQSGYVAEIGYGFRIMPHTLLTPLLSYEFVRSRIGGYTESGGSFPAEFEAVTIKDSFLRTGAQLRQDLTEKLAATFEGNYIDRLSSTGNSISGRIAGLGDIGAFAENVDLTKNWTELRAGLSYVPDWPIRNLRLTFGYTANLGQRFDVSAHRLDTGFVLYF